MEQVLALEPTDYVSRDRRGVLRVNEWTWPLHGPRVTGIAVSCRVETGYLVLLRFRAPSPDAIHALAAEITHCRVLEWDTAPVPLRAEGYIWQGRTHVDPPNRVFLDADGTVFRCPHAVNVSGVAAVHGLSAITGNFVLRTGTIPTFEQEHTPPSNGMVCVTSDGASTAVVVTTGSVAGWACFPAHIDRALSMRTPVLIGPRAVALWLHPLGTVLPMVLIWLVGEYLAAGRPFPRPAASLPPPVFSV